MMREVAAVIVLVATAVCASAEPDPSAVPTGAYPTLGHPWENTSLGMDEIVPAPWTPVVVAGDEVRVWGREFVPAEGPLPAQITSQGVALFAEAPQLHGRIAGPDVSWRRGTTEATDLRASWTRSADAADCTLSAARAPRAQGRATTASSRRMLSPLVRSRASITHVPGSASSARPNGTRATPSDVW